VGQRFGSFQLARSVAKAMKVLTAPPPANGTAR
jgi:hypothetical protein